MKEGAFAEVDNKRKSSWWIVELGLASGVLCNFKDPRTKT